MKNSLYTLLVAAVLLSACSAPSTETPSAPLPVDPAGSTMPALTDPSQPMTVNTGEIFMIVVEANPTTGYQWEIVGDSTGVELVSQEYTAAEPILPGSSGVDVWMFKAITAGETQITLGYFPPDTNVTEPEQTKVFTVIVK